jgi:hypothetical protein
MTTTTEVSDSLERVDSIFNMLDEICDHMDGFSSAEDARLSSITETLRTGRYVMHETESKGDKRATRSPSDDEVQLVLGDWYASAKTLFPVGTCVTASAKCPRKIHGAHQIAVQRPRYRYRRAAHRSCRTD